MGYAINSTHTGWRAVDSAADLAAKETFSAALPTLPPPPLSLVDGYAQAIALPVTITTHAGVAKAYQADADSRQKVHDMLAAYSPAGALPADFYWVATDNTQVPFVLADLQELAAALGAQGWAAFQKLQTLKAQGATIWA